MLSKLITDGLHYLDKRFLIYSARGGVNRVAVNQHCIVPALRELSLRADFVAGAFDIFDHSRVDYGFPLCEVVTGGDAQVNVGYDDDTTIHLVVYRGLKNIVGRGGVVTTAYGGRAARAECGKQGAYPK